MSIGAEQPRLVDWNRTATPFPDRCVHELISESAARAPDATAVEFEGRRLAYWELEDRACRLAAYLRELGVGPEVLVGVALERSLEMVVAVLGVMKAGGAYVPLDPAYPAERIAFMLDDAKAPVLLTQEPLIGSLPHYAGRTVCIDRDWPAISERPSVAPEGGAHPGNLAYVIYTSGSTGRPKGVMVEHRGLTNVLHAMRRTPGLTRGDSMLAVTTLSFDIAGVELYLPLIAGARVVVVSRRTSSDGRLLLDALERSGATVVQATPATWRLLLEAGWDGTPGLRALCGGEALPVSVARRLLERCGEVWNLYGPTEATIWSTLQRVESADDATSIGLPFANTEVHVLDERLERVTPGTAGELHIGGVGLARGYLNRPELTAERFVANSFDERPNARLYRTGDLVRQLPDGRLEFLGRIDSQIKLRGFRIELGEIETLLEEHDDVRAAVAVAREQDGDKRLLAYVLPSDGRVPGSAELRRYLAGRLPEYMVPAAIAPLDELPLTPNGKVDRKALPDIDQDAASERVVVPPGDDVEARLVAIWESVLGISPVGVRDDFFDLGVSSLTAARLFAAMEKAFGRRLPIAPVFEAPTIERLARLLRGTAAAEQRSSLVPIRSAGDRVPLFCVHGGAGTVLFYHDLARRLGPGQPVYGLQARGIYGRETPLLTVEEMARHYVDEIAAVQPAGPYRLMGYCFGGIVAYEMAQQLRRRGGEVELLALINSPSPAYIAAHNPFFRPEGDEAPPEPPPKSGLRAWAGSRAWGARSKLRWLRLRAYLALRRPLPDDVRNGYFLLVAHYAERRYEARPYDGEVLQLHGEGLYLEPDLGWKELVPTGLNSVEIPGRHVIPRDSMSEPRVGFVADRLERSLTAVEAPAAAAVAPAP